MSLNKAPNEVIQRAIQATEELASYATPVERKAEPPEPLQAAAEAAPHFRVMVTNDPRCRVEVTPKGGPIGLLMLGEGLVGAFPEPRAAMLCGMVEELANRLGALVHSCQEKHIAGGAVTDAIATLQRWERARTMEIKVPEQRRVILPGDPG